MLLEEKQKNDKPHNTFEKCLIKPEGMQSLSELKVQKGKGLPLGATVLDNKHVQFSIALPREEQCTLYLYKKGQRESYARICMTEEDKIGGIFSTIIELKNPTQFEYKYQVKEQACLDPYAKQIVGREIWGMYKSEAEKELLHCAIVENKNTVCPKPVGKLAFEELILYRLHVRGFTKDETSKVKHKGTFKGLEEKIPYLSKLGINGIMLMPAYEFDEIFSEKESQAANLQYWNQKELEEARSQENKINFWGYAQDCNYFAPKTSYAADTKNPIREMKQMIAKMHEKGIEVFLEIFFAAGTNQILILDCLRYWVTEYGIDGFKINDEVVYGKLIATDPILARTKFLATSWDTRAIYEDGLSSDYRNLAEYNDGFLVDCRRYLKGDEEQVNKFLNRMKKNPRHCAVVNYISNTNGFTLMDMVSYDIKHNEANGEQGKDGTDYNYSWNCGFEGKCRRKQVVQLRLKQIKNAMLMLLFSQGTPMLLAGDEFGNSQEGNNNAYCQDNEIGWVNWNKNVMHSRILEFVKQVIQIRKEHPILHRKEELRGMDYIASGVPDISFHGTKPWYPDLSNYSRVLGILLYGKYAPLNKRKSDCSFYFAYNMHWEVHVYDLPQLPKARKWRVLIDTARNVMEEKETVLLQEKGQYMVQPRSVVVFVEI